MKSDLDLNKRISICLAGALPDTNNLGVSALCTSTIAGIVRRVYNANLTVFDCGKGVRSATFTDNARSFEYKLCGAVHSRRLYRRESLWNMRMSAMFGGLGNPGVRAIAHADAVLDISGGDSFTDLYGRRRFNGVALPKLITLQLQRPLILLPQTYGPFKSRRSRRIAKRLVRGATAAWARDERSFIALRELLGEAFDPNRHHSGVDVAFLLPKFEPVKPLPEPIHRWLNAERERPTIGFNISGLIYNDPKAAVQRYGFRADYRQLVKEFLRRILEETEANILLIPHVLVEFGHYESDPSANQAVANELHDITDKRLAIVPPDYDQSEMKWIISHCDWFCGTRMHSTIAGLSTGVPTAAIAYSIKTQGVFETCGQGEHVMDPRQRTTDEMVNALFISFQQRELTRPVLAEHLPSVKQQAEQQMDQIIATCLGEHNIELLTEHP